MAVDTGHGATLVFGTQGGSYNIVSIDGHEDSRPDVDTTHLGTTTNQTTMPGDLLELATFTVKIQFQGSDGLPSYAAAETITVTHPQAVGEASAANIAGTAFINRRKWPDMNTNELKIAEFDIKWDGVTGPTLTVAT